MTKGVVSRSMSAPAETVATQYSAQSIVPNSCHDIQTLFITGLTVAHTVLLFSDVWFNLDF
jgi:hypothetical protein